MPQSSEGAEGQAAEQAAVFWNAVNESYQARKSRGRAVVNQVVRDAGERVVGAMASIEGSIDQPIMVDHGRPITTGDVFLVENDGTDSLPIWNAIRLIHSASAVPSAGELPTLPTPSGLALATGVILEAPSVLVSAWILATWDALDTSLYGRDMQYEVQYCTNDTFSQPTSHMANWAQPVTSTGAFPVASDDTIIIRTPFVESPDALDDFPFRGTLRIEAEKIWYSTHVAGQGVESTGIGGDGTLTDPTASWEAERWVNYILVDAAGARFKITGNDAQALYVSGSVASGLYSINPGFTGCVRGYENTTPVQHNPLISIISESCGAMLQGIATGMDYNVRLRAIRFDGAISTWTAWQTITTHHDTVAPPAPTGFAVESTAYGVAMEWTGPTILTCSDLGGFYIWEAEDDAGTGAAFRGMIGNRTEALLYTPGYNAVRYYALQSVDTSGNMSSLTDWLPARTAPIGGANLLPNSDFEVFTEGQPDYWIVDTLNDADWEWGNFGLGGSKGIKMTIGAGEGQRQVGLLAPSPYSSWPIYAEVGSLFTVSLHYKTDYTGDINLNYTWSAEAPVAGDANLYFWVFTHNGTAASLPMDFWNTPAQISELADGWKRVQYTVEITEESVADGYYWLGVVLGIWTHTIDFNMIMYLDRVQGEFGANATAWTASAVAPPGTGLRIGADAIIGAHFYLDANGLFRSHLVPATDYLYDLGAPGNRWRTAYVETLVVEEIQSMGDPLVLSAHAPTHLPGGADPITTAAATTLGVSSTNTEGSAESLGRSDHTHAITASAAPGLGADLLKTDANGGLNLASNTLVVDGSLARVGVGTNSPDSKLHVSGEARIDGDLVFVGPQEISTTTDSLTITAADELILAATGSNVKVAASADLRSSAWTSGPNGTGWDMTYAGDLDCRGIYTEEMTADAFTYLAARATNGSIMLVPSVAEVSRNFVVPAVSGTGTLYVYDLPGMEDVAAFTSGDWVRLRYIDTTGEPAVIGDAWGQVTSYSNLTGGEQSWTFTTGSTTVSGKTVFAGTIALDYGVSGDGLWQATVIHTHSPFHRIQTWSGANPYAGSFTTWVQSGKLTGLDAGWGYGFYAGNNTTNSYLLASSTAFEVHGIASAWYDASGNKRIEIDPTATGASQSLLWAGSDSSDKKFDVRANGDVRIEDALILGPGNAGAVDRADLHLVFNGGQPYNLNYSVNLSGTEGQVATVQTNVIGRPGRFGKGVQVSEATVNQVYNPIAGGATQYALTGSATITRVTGYAAMGTYSYQVSTTATGDGIRMTTPALANAGHYLTFMVRGDVSSFNVKVTNGTDHAAVLLGDYYGWAVYGYEFSSSEANASTWVEIKRASGTGTLVAWIDCIQLEQKAHGTPCAHGDQPDVTWGGTAHASISTRSVATLTYGSPALRNSGTFMAYVMLTSRHADTANNRTIALGNSTYGIGINISTSDYLVLWAYDGARVTYQLNDTNFPAFTWHHVAATWDQDGDSMDLYLNGESVGSASYTDFTAGTGWYIGHWAGINHLPGYIDDVLITDKVFSADEINMVYNSGMPTSFVPDGSILLTGGAGVGWVRGDAYGLFGHADDGDPVWGLMTTDATSWGGSTFDAGDIVIGDPASGHLVWDASTKQMEARDSLSAVQSYWDTSGAFRAGAGAVFLDATGVNIHASTISVDSIEKNSVRWVDPAAEGTDLAWVASYKDATGSNVYIQVRSEAPTGYDAHANIRSVADDGENSTASIAAETASRYCAVIPSIDTSGNNVLTITADEIDIDGDSGFPTPSCKFTLTGYMIITRDTGGDDVEVHLRDSRVAHGMTSVLTTDTFGKLLAYSDTEGGLDVQGANEATVGLRLVGAGVTDNTTKSTAGLGYIVAQASKKSGTSVSNAGTNANLFVVRDYSSTRAIIDKEGELHLDATVSESAWDDYDDLSLLHGFRAAVAPSLQERWGGFIQEARPVLEAMGVATFSDDGEVWYGVRGMQMLTIDALRQFSEFVLGRLEQYETAMVEAKILDERDALTLKRLQRRM